MTIIANKVQLNLEPAMPVNLAEVADTDTAQPLRVRLGGLALIRYKPAKLAYVVRTVGTTAAATLALMSGATVIAQRNLDLSGEGEAGSIDVDLSQLAGESELFARVSVTDSGGAGESATVDARIDIDPVTAIFE